jgi:hypothetical protein
LRDERFDALEPLRFKIVPVSAQNKAVAGVFGVPDQLDQLHQTLELRLVLLHVHAPTIKDGDGQMMTVRINILILTLGKTERVWGMAALKPAYGGV